MVFLKEDGSLDIERINNLPIDEYINVIENLTDEQHQYYNSQLPINDGTQHTKAILVDYTLEDEIARGAVDAESFLKKMRQNYLIDRIDP